MFFRAPAHAVDEARPSASRAFFRDRLSSRPDIMQTSSFGDADGLAKDPEGMPLHGLISEQVSSLLEGQPIVAMTLPWVDG